MTARVTVVVAVLTGLIATSVTAASAASTQRGIGGVDMQRACDTQYPNQGSRAVVTNGASAYSWQCSGRGIDVTAACTAQYGYGAESAVGSAADPYSWYCRWRTTQQMTNAVAWATAEKNSPDPTRSDHWGINWSGWCERFVEQAEGFRFTNGSAIENYNRAAAAGRLHTDANPPPGALVYWGGGGGNGHVAVSIGKGQVIGTLGSPGQRLPVSQYAVTYLSNPYLGWAYPIGS